MAEFESTPSSNDNAEIDAIFSALTGSDDIALMTKAARDPFIEDAQKNARAYNEIFAHEGIVAVDESMSIQRQLDAQWIGVDEEYVRVTGRVFIEKDGVETPYVVTNASMKSRGFTVRGAYIEDDEGIAYLEKPKMYLAFKVGRTALDANYTGKGARRKVWAYADVDEVLVEASTVSRERAAAWVEVNYPELFEEINSRVFNSEGDEGSTLLSLQGLDLASFVPIDDDFVRECVESYIQDVVDIDRQIHYSAGVNGSYAMKYKNDEKTSELDALLKESVLARVSAPYIGCEIGENAPDQWSILADLIVSVPGKNEPPVHIQVSIDALKALQSIRADYYGS